MYFVLASEANRGYGSQIAVWRKRQYFFLFRIDWKYILIDFTIPDSFRNPMKEVQ